MFVDKLFAAEFYYTREMYMDTAKHLYDIANLYKTQIIKDFINNRDELNKLVEYKKKEKKIRKGGINSELKIKDFTYFKKKFKKEFLNEFENMQNKYLLNSKYKLKIEDIILTLDRILENDSFKNL